MIPIARPTFLGREEEYVLSALRTRGLSCGPFVKTFESLVCSMATANHAVATTSGTTALHLALLALGLRKGQRVVVPACSYIATVNAVTYCGGVPVFCDVDPVTWVTSRMAMEEAIKETNAVGAITVALYGQPCEIPRVPGVWVVEDLCEAHGLPLRGDAAVFSFYGNKIVTCGEGGAVVTDRPDVAETCRILRGQGTTGVTRYIHEELGYNYRMTDLQAAVGCGQLEMLKTHLTRRAELWEEYDLCFALNGMLTQKRLPGAVSWVAPVRVNQRDEVARNLYARGIETRPVFPPLHKQPKYRIQTSLPVAERLAEDGLLLPLHLGMSLDGVRFICESLQLATKQKAA